MSRRQYTNVEKVAILLICLGDKLSAEILGHLEPNEVRIIAQAMRRLGRIDADSVKDVVFEFTDLLKKQEKSRTITNRKASDFLKKTLKSSKSKSRP